MAPIDTARLALVVVLASGFGGLAHGQTPPAAQVHARLGHCEQACRCLQRAIGAGFDDRARHREDETFEDWRDEGLFKRLIRRAWARGYYDLLERPDREDVQKSPEIMKALKAGNVTVRQVAAAGFVVRASHDFLPEQFSVVYERRR